ncbi:hypothetical protein [Actinokineospora iranica]|uniref:Uncharacterized protein n=1 Tax=Actinokineospora iranica TaxID=1271860 RepID=A0A1G6S0P5_9PSEU|nr:hypothetical protein [Actinokineospora iranica]SDD10500.1 hypothetical protein SAMN05216174_107154 [Actinokineospora iranica]
MIATDHGATQVRPDGTFVLPTTEGSEIRVDGEPHGEVGKKSEIDLR